VAAGKQNIHEHSSLINKFQAPTQNPSLALPPLTSVTPTSPASFVLCRCIVWWPPKVGKKVALERLEKLKNMLAEKERKGNRASSFYDGSISWN